MADEQRPVSREDMERFWQENKGLPSEQPPHIYDRRRPIEIPISSHTRIQFTPLQVWLILAAVVSGACAFCTMYYGITGRIDTQKNEMNVSLYEVKTQLAEINFRLKGTVTRDDFHGWTDRLRDSNPNLRVPAPNLQTP